MISFSGLSKTGFFIKSIPSMQTTTSFRGINTQVAGTIAQSARMQGADISSVITMLRNGTTLKGMATSSLLAGFTHAAHVWAGGIVLGLGDHPGAPGTPQQSTREKARTCALEVRSWLEETRLVNDKPTHLVECTDAQRARFDAIIDRLLNIAENG